MRRSPSRRLRLLAACTLLFPAWLLSQTISYQSPASFFVCDEAPFTVTVNNTTGATLSGLLLTVHFTTSSGAECGVEYVPGSVGGATESDISDLTTPVFSLSNMADGTSLNLDFQAIAACPAVACIDGAEFFVNQITLQSSAGTVNVTTNPYVVERGLLVITAVNSYVMSGSLGDILQRKITVRNTRPGALKNFVFIDTHQGGISISSPQGANQSAAPNTFQLLLDGANFDDIGDNDELFELNEAIVITENILITDCGVEITSTVSSLEVGWSCDPFPPAGFCQSVNANAIVTIQPSQQEPELTFEPGTSVAECFCGPEGHPQSMTITNEGNGAASSVTLQVLHWSPTTGAIDTASIVVDSAGVLIPVSISYGFVGEVEAPCQADGVVTGLFILTIPAISPGASVTVHWEVIFCGGGCAEPEVTWRYKYSYFKPCPPAPFIEQTDFIQVNDKGDFLLTFLKLEPPGLMDDDSSYAISYEIVYDSLTALNDTLVVEYELPCGMIYHDDNELLLNGQAPLDITLDQGSESLIITARYQLPLNADTATALLDFTFDCEELCFEDQICKDTLITSCAAVDTCEIFPNRLITATITTTLRKCHEEPDECNLQRCINLGMAHNCPIDSLCIKQPPGYVSYRSEALRKNYGLPDNDNNQFPNGTSLDFNLVRRDRLIAGDTIHGMLRGAVVIDEAGATLPFGAVSMSFSQSHLTMPNADSLLSEEGILPAGVQLRIFDQSAGQWFECSDLNPTVTNDARLTFHYDISTGVLPGCLPPGFAYDQGDSIIFEAEYRIEFNINRELDSDPLLGWLNLSPSMAVWKDTFEAAIDHYNCGCSTQKFELSGYEYSILPGIFALPPCANSLFVGGSLLRLELEDGNFFPFEHRNLLTALDWQVLLPEDIALVQTKMTFLRFQDGAVLQSNAPLTPVFADSMYSFNLLPFQTQPLDEGFSALFQYIFDAPCDIAGSNPATFVTHLAFVPGLPEPIDTLEVSVSANALRALTANLVVEALNYNLISFNNQLAFDFTLGNYPTVVASQTSGAAPNAWLYVTSNSGLVTDFQLINFQTGQPVPSVNGVFQLGNYPVDTVSFQLQGINNSCAPEDLVIHYGWNCDPYLSQFAEPCNFDIRPISLLSPPGEIDFLVSSPNDCSDLCDTIPYHTLEIFNAQLGAVYDLTLTAILPPGLNVMSGSCQVEYPSGSGIFLPITDPVAIAPPSIVAWDLTGLLALLNGLPGVASAPDNALKIRFLSETTCDFIANSFLLFTIAAQQNCGVLTNTVSKPGEPLCIEGVGVPYSVSINAAAEPGFGCNDVTGFEITLNSSTILPTGACVVVTLPFGVSYVAGSCSSACQANFNCVPTVLGNQLTWQLPAGIPPNQLICFSFETNGWSNLGCEDGIVLIQTATATQAFCQATGQTCSVKVSTGANLLQYDIQRPAFDLSDFLVNASQSGTNDLLNFSLDIGNTGAQNEPPLLVDFYLDTDGNGSGDLFLQTQSMVASIPTGSSVTMTGSLVIPSGNLCNLVAYINPDQCLCSGDSVFVTFPITYQTSFSEVVCSDESLTVGIASQPGFNYTWSPTECLANPAAASTVFDCINDEDTPQTYDFSLTASNGECSIEHLLDVTVQPQPGIVFAETPICQGESANLAASDGVTFNWSGPGITNPDLQIQTVMPATTSTYFVTVTDAEGCTGTDGVVIQVAPLPVADAGSDTTFCPGAVARLNAVFDDDFEYSWTPVLIGGSPALNNPTIHNPLILSNVSQVYQLTVTTPSGCSDTDEVSVTFGDTLMLQLPADLTICLGTSTTLTASGGLTYTWSPPGNCQNPECSSVVVSPVLTTTYTVSAEDATGCPGFGEVTVTVTTDIILTTGAPIEICEGQSAVIFEIPQTQAGIYCDTVPLASGCDSVHCIQLLVNPAPDTTLWEATICQGESVEFQGETFSEAVTHCVSIAVPGSPCDSLVCLQLTVLDTPQVQLLVPDTLFLGNLTELSIEPTAFDSILWFGGNISGQCTNSPVCTDSLGEAGTFIYSVLVTGDNGCVGRSEKPVTAGIQCEVEKADLPNVFSPNGDGLNDTFTIVAPAAETVLEMKIWNRWGQKVYEGTGPWDGTQKGEQAASDVYVYLIRVGCPVGVESEERVLKGDVTLVR